MSSDTKSVKLRICCILFFFISILSNVFQRLIKIKLICVFFLHPTCFDSRLNNGCFFPSFPFFGNNFSPYWTQTLFYVTIRSQLLTFWLGPLESKLNHSEMQKGGSASDLQQTWKLVYYKLICSGKVLYPFITFVQPFLLFIWRAEYYFIGSDPVLHSRLSSRIWIRSRCSLIHIYTSPHVVLWKGFKRKATRFCLKWCHQWFLFIILFISSLHRQTVNRKKICRQVEPDFYLIVH